MKRSAGRRCIITGAYLFKSQCENFCCEWSCCLRFCTKGLTRSVIRGYVLRGFFFFFFITISAISRLAGWQDVREVILSLPLTCLSYSTHTSLLKTIRKLHHRPHIPSNMTPDSQYVVTLSWNRSSDCFMQSSPACSIIHTHSLHAGHHDLQHLQLHSPHPLTFFSFYPLFSFLA